MIKNAAMRGGSNRALLLLALMLGLASAVLVGIFLSQLDGESGGGPGIVTKPVVVAAHDIPAKTRITVEMVTVRELPESAVLTGAFTSTDSLIGQVTQVPIVAGEQVLPAKVIASEVALAQFGDNTPLSLLVAEGRRGFAISLSQVAAAGGLVRAGDFVDVILSRAHAIEGGETFLTPGSACYVVQDIEVLAVGDSVKVATDTEVSGIAAAGTNTEAVAMTLSVTPDEAWWLAAAQQSVDKEKVGNQLWVSLRPFGERGELEALPLCGVIPGA